MHFLRKNDGKASLRGYMHTNWPQQKQGGRRGMKKVYRNFLFETRKTDTCSRGYTTKTPKALLMSMG